ncbi:MAG: polymerase subunit sigma-24 [Ramlibacter sp.]|nr:polymerase subunit sigma-24 [Ramlibacter sp.]
MLAYADGDDAAFDLLYGRHEAALFRLVRRLLGSAMAAQAEEVFQDSWLRIVAARRSFVPQGAAWRTWGFTIAHNAAIDGLRAGGRAVGPDGGGEGDDPLERLMDSLEQVAPSAADIAFWRSAGAQLLQCPDALPPPQRAAFLLHHEDGASVEDLAQRLALPFETAKSRLRDALKKLRGCMGDYLLPLGATR